MEIVVFVSLAVALIAVCFSLLALTRIARLGFTEIEPDLPLNPGGCSVNSHVWRKRPSLISGHEAVYQCLKNCGSSLRHRVD